MIVAERYKDKKAAVFGLGRSGLSAIKSIITGGGEVFAGDDKMKSLQDAAALGATVSAISEIPWKEVTSLILSPGVPLHHPEPHPVVKMAKEAGVEIIGDLEVLYRQESGAKYIGITGTNGKSTTTALTYHILKMAGFNVQVGGNYGIPVLSLEAENNGIYVLEVSSYQLELLDTFRFDISALLNITPDHIERHGSMLGYISAKKKIFDHLKADGEALIGIDDQFSAGVLDFLTRFEKRGKIYPISVTTQLGGGFFAEGGSVVNSLSTNRILQYDISEVESLKGQHNWQNACVAVGVASLLGVNEEAIFKGLASFPGLAHRMEKVGEIDGISFINDSKATNAEAAAKALSCYRNILWIAGGKPKEGGISSLEPFFPAIIKAYLIGEAEEEFAKTLEGKLDYERCGSLANAFAKAAEDAWLGGTMGATVLLSPACASFDQWANFEARGDAFRAMARDYIAVKNQSSDKLS